MAIWTKWETNILENIDDFETDTGIHLLSTSIQSKGVYNDAKDDDDTT